ncbi:MAG TPA: class I SAM-dependent methyltransferase [Chthoniobacterales bacterium]|nr:class I SAM-dependent methyltransferase [Chthoniobacterales bacterium]
MRFAAFCKSAFRSATKNYRRKTGDRQDTEIYFDPAFTEVLETWAVRNAWREIQVLLGERSGKVLDLACGTGRTYDFLKRFENLDCHGCDISPMLIERAIQRGISKERLQALDATKLDCADNEFDFVFSIGSLEHFTVKGLGFALAECRRVSRGLNFHMVPVSSSGLDEGWITPYQSYWNNSQRWWTRVFEETFGENVWVMSSRWQDEQSRGVWFICGREEGFVND